MVERARDEVGVDELFNTDYDNLMVAELFSDRLSYEQAELSSLQDMFGIESFKSMYGN
jgi:hypothetical protein